MNSRLQKILYLVVPSVLIIWLLGYEFFGRYEQGFDMTRQIKITSHSGGQRIVFVQQHSTDPVDTIRRIFANLKNSKVSCTIWLDGSRDTIRTEAIGRYFSELRPTKISTDSSTQVVLIPNSEHDLPTGWGELLYLTPTDSLRMIQIINANITDKDKDGILELFDKTQGAWTHLDPATGNWMASQIQN
jgi:hypothetical protein